MPIAGPASAPVRASPLTVAARVGALRDEAVAATVASARRAVRRVRDDIGGDLSRGIFVCRIPRKAPPTCVNTRRAALSEDNRRGLNQEA